MDVSQDLGRIRYGDEEGFGMKREEVGERKSAVQGRKRVKLDSKKDRDLRW
jgi:hypothetical protein